MKGFIQVATTVPTSDEGTKRSSPAAPGLLEQASQGALVSTGYFLPVTSDSIRQHSPAMRRSARRVGPMAPNRLVR